MKAGKLLWWNDKKLLSGFILLVLSIVLGFWGKVIIIAKLYKPVGLLTGLSIYAFSWLLLFLGIFLVGLETIKMMQARIHHHVKATVRKTYHYTKKLPKRGIDYTKSLHKISIAKLKSKSK